MKLPRRNFLHLAAGAAALPAVSHFAWAQTYPSKPVTIVVPFAAGGPVDLRARSLAEHMRSVLGQPIIIENVSGAAGSLGAGRVARSAPDGYTLAIRIWSTHVVNAAVYRLNPHRTAPPALAYTLRSAPPSARRGCGMQTCRRPRRSRAAQTTGKAPRRACRGTKTGRAEESSGRGGRALRGDRRSSDHAPASRPPRSQPRRAGAGRQSRESRARFRRARPCAATAASRVTTRHSPAPAAGDRAATRRDSRRF